MSSSRKYLRAGTDAIIRIAPRLIKEQDLDALEALREEISYRERTRKALAPTLRLIEEAIITIQDDQKTKETFNKFKTNFVELTNSLVNFLLLGCEQL